jgi:hypothetical protein
LLLAFNVSKRSYLNSDLSIDSREYPNLAAEIERFFHSKDQASLKQLRQDMANALAEYLKPTRKSRAPTPSQTVENFDGYDNTRNEPDSRLRYAYIKAIITLGVDVDGRGHYIHSILDKVAESDASEAVRSAAHEASDTLRRYRDGWDSGSHEQHLMNAFWWIKQAHKLILGEPIDEERARIVYQQEIVPHRNMV